MYMFSFSLHIILTVWFLILGLLVTYAEFSPSITQNSRVERLPSGSRVNFTWISSETNNSTSILNYNEAQQRCSTLFSTNSVYHSYFSKRSEGRLPNSNEVKYFYKTIFLSLNEAFFYIQNVLEATIDFPSESEGERLCLILNKSIKGPVSKIFVIIYQKLKLADVPSEASCQTRVNLLVCAYDLPSSDGLYTNQVFGNDRATNAGWISELEKKAVFAEESVCLPPFGFYSIIAILISLIFAILAIVGLFFYKWKNLKANSDSLYPIARRSSYIFGNPPGPDLFNCGNFRYSARTTSTSAATMSQNFDFLSNKKMDFLDDLNSNKNDTSLMPSNLRQLQNESIRASLRRSEGTNEHTKLKIGPDPQLIEEDDSCVTDFL